MEDYPRPRLVVSRCLELAACRYNGATIRAPLVRRLEPYVELVPICPEVEVGLGVPRDPVRLVSPGDPPGGGGALARRELRMVQPKSGRDLTAAMNSFSDDFLSRVEPVEGFLLKSRSPSCGIKDTKVYTDAEEPMPLGKDAGLFARAVLDRFGDRAVEDEGRLTNFRLRHHFLTKLFTLARIRTLEDGGRMRDLVELHTRHKLLLMAYHQTCMRRMGRLVGSSDGLPFPELLAAYRRELGTALARPARTPSHINVLMHGFGYFKNRLSPAEKEHFLDLLEELRANRLPLFALLHALRGWIARFDEGYLRQQLYFEPYPRELIDLSDSGGSIH
jgi:uncharacterized protein YbgA (DUF1722 family)/uncharacterized protein YbbK (DUF523 family)